MKELAIKRELDEETRKEGVFFDGITVLSLHIKGDEVIITDNSDYSKIYAIYSKEFFWKTAK